MANKYTKNRKTLSRTSAAEQTRSRAFLIVTEGAKTEPIYFEHLRQILKLTNVRLEIVHPAATDPVSLATKALELRKEREQLCKKNISLMPFDEVWVVVDLEKPNDIRHSQLKEAKAISGADVLKFAVSYPCFEYWLLLHFEYSTRPCSCCADTGKQVSKHVVGYAKGAAISFNLASHLPQALKNAQRVTAYHSEAGSAEYGNPSTTVHDLIDAIQKSVRGFDKKLETASKVFAAAKARS